jgi:2-(1,2-epoxy-1,2-dihydrophenyl)acetyl-CoA isomerase
VTFETVSLEHHDSVALVSLNRPEALNSFNATQRADLLAAVREVNADEGVRVAVLTGSGRAFSAGADLQETPENGGSVETQLNEEYKPILMAISEAPKPWISAVNGACAGIGSSFAMACDLSVMAENAYIYQAFTAISLVPDGGATWHLVRTLGPKRAYEVIVSGEKISAQKCLDWGLCNRVVPADDLVPHTLAWAAEAAAKAPLALRYAKQALNGAIENSLGETISAEARLQAICVQSEDAKEGVHAFLEKRPPVWQGR